jgi:hypothetical protein
MTAIAACRTCGTEPREGARFCDGCGAPVTDQDTRAEYKQVKGGRLRFALPRAGSRRRQTDLLSVLEPEADL